MSYDPKPYHRAYYQAHRETHKARTRQRHAERAATVNALKLSTGCADCGYKEHAEALDFDHLPGFQKTRPVANSKCCHWDTMLAEIAKCEVVCANCHRIRTANRRAQTQQPVPLIPIPATGIMYQES